MNCRRAAVVCLVLVAGGQAIAQLITHPIDSFERVRWDWTLGQIRALSKDSALTEMVAPQDRKGGRERSLVFWRGEVVFGRPQRVVYRLRASDSVVQQVAIMWIEAALDAEEAFRAHAALWDQIQRRYGTPTSTFVGEADERVWITATSTIKAVRVKGHASGVVLLARPAASPP